MTPPSSGPSVPELQKIATKLARTASKQGTLGQLTQRIIRRNIEEQLGLVKGSLDDPQYKGPIKEATLNAIKQKEDTDEEDVKEEDSPPKSKPSAKKTSKAEAKPKAIANQKGKEKVVTPPSTIKKRKANGKLKMVVESDGDGEESEVANVEAETNVTTPKKAKRAIPNDEEVVGGDEEEDSLWGSPVKKPTTKGKEKAKPMSKSSSAAKSKPKSTPKSKSKTKSRTVVSESEEDEEVADSEKEDEEEEDYEDTEKSKPTSKQKKVETPKPTSSKVKANEKGKQNDNKKFKSLEHVPTSDMEQDEPDDTPAAADSISTIKKPTLSTTKKPFSKSSDAASRKVASAKPTSKSKPESKSKAKTDAIDIGDEEGNKSDSSELSVLIDEPPKKKRKSASGTAEKKTTKSTSKRSAKAGPALSKDEETIKRLKNLIVACGMRKVWSRFLQDCDTPQQEIKKLKEALAELGMTGRMSLEQAKVIKERRELAQELEDVQEFAKKTLSRHSRSRSAANSNDDEGKSDQGKNEDDSEEEVPVPRRKTNARASIMTFLQDQSDSEE